MKTKVDIKTKLNQIIRDKTKCIIIKKLMTKFDIINK